ncbi:dephospho-CoA kinase [Winogradskyella maritima]|uniref:Dephospho-CoA kinase n=1 Tax=Winogradskyella maritima TaxID=1517766 RepID=A0ABV8ADP9_9FLAO|nr:dephospho-CoA kinase [Winogradskyella maritima]
MKIVGITGGIGSGKTTVCSFFESWGVPVYYADKEAKALMNRSKVIRRKLTSLFGEASYVNDELNRDFIRKQIFENAGLLEQMNSIVHPKVASNFKRWVKKQDAPYILKEAAIIFEIGQEHAYDAVILVVANEDERIKRVIKRDCKTAKEVKAIIENQWPDSEKEKKADFTITNNRLDKAEKEALAIHKTLLKN